MTARYGAVTALKEISFDVNEGEIVAMIGPNRLFNTFAVIDAVIATTDENHIPFHSITSI